MCRSFPEGPEQTFFFEVEKILRPSWDDFWLLWKSIFLVCYRKHFNFLVKYFSPTLVGCLGDAKQTDRPKTRRSNDRNDEVRESVGDNPVISMRPVNHFNLTA